MAGLNNIREAYEQVYAQLDERMDPEERALRRAEIADKKASRMDAKVAAKYAGSEARSAEREDKKSRGKHIHGMADSVELDGDLVDEGVVGDRARNAVADDRLSAEQEKTDASMDRLRAQTKRHNKSTALARTQARIAAKKSEDTARAMHPKPGVSGRRVDEAKDDSYLETDMNKRQRNNEKAIEDMKKTKAHADMVKAARKHFGEAVYGGEKKQPKDDRMVVTNADKTANTKAWQNYKAGHPSYKAAPHLTKEEMIAHLKERALDAAEKREKESVFKAIKPSKLAKTYPEKSPKELKSLRYAISTAQAKKNMDTSRSDKRYGTEA